MRPLLLLFIVLPVLEMWVLITVGREIGALPTIGLVFLTAIVGVTLLRRQGLSTLMRAQEKMRTGDIPAKEMVEGIFLAVGGALLLTPGFITDAIGFACLIPGLRQLLLGRLLRHVTIVRPGGPHRSDSSQRGPDIIEGEFSRDERKSRERVDHKHDKD
ncbi:FxsA family protein [Microbulbifer sp. CnH-101-G]|uniref:FxsA family protein n=1 Tax=Microbulbifer sp. CnH-101-G TaxID=3243393 RepID=UPI00403A5436